jgi:hypothetical protein
MVTSRGASRGRISDRSSKQPAALGGAAVLHSSSQLRRRGPYLWRQPNAEVGQAHSFSSDSWRNSPHELGVSISRRGAPATPSVLPWRRRSARADGKGVLG